MQAMTLKWQFIVLSLLIHFSSILLASADNNPLSQKQCAYEFSLQNKGQSFSAFGTLAKLMADRKSEISPVQNAFLYDSGFRSYLYQLGYKNLLPKNPSIQQKVFDKYLAIQAENPKPAFYHIHKTSWWKRRGMQSKQYFRDLVYNPSRIMFAPHDPNDIKQAYQNAFSPHAGFSAKIKYLLWDLPPHILMHPVAEVRKSRRNFSFLSSSVVFGVMASYALVYKVQTQEILTQSVQTKIYETPVLNAQRFLFESGEWNSQQLQNSVLNYALIHKNFDLISSKHLLETSKIKQALEERRDSYEMFFANLNLNLSPEKKNALMLLYTKSSWAKYKLQKQIKLKTTSLEKAETENQNIESYFLKQFDSIMQKQSISKIQKILLQAFGTGELLDIYADYAKMHKHDKLMQQILADYDDASLANPAIWQDLYEWYVFRQNPETPVLRLELMRKYELITEEQALSLHPLLSAALFAGDLKTHSEALAKFETFYNALSLPEVLRQYLFQSYEPEQLLNQAIQIKFAANSELTETQSSHELSLISLIYPELLLSNFVPNPHNSNNEDAVQSILTYNKFIELSSTINDVYSPNSREALIGIAKEAGLLHSTQEQLSEIEKEILYRRLLILHLMHFNLDALKNKSVETNLNSNKKNNKSAIVSADKSPFLQEQDLKLSLILKLSEQLQGLNKN